jgi:hypothetical protein
MCSIRDDRFSHRGKLNTSGNFTPKLPLASGPPIAVNQRKNRQFILSATPQFLVLPEIFGDERNFWFKASTV